MACSTVHDLNFMSIWSRTQVHSTHHDHALLLTVTQLPHRIIDNFMAQVQHLQLVLRAHACAEACHCMIATMT